MATDINLATRTQVVALNKVLKEVASELLTLGNTHSLHLITV